MSGDIQAQPSSTPSMTDLRRQAVSLTLQLWDEYGVHPVHVQYKDAVNPEQESGLQATVSNATELVNAAAGDAFTVLARSVSAAPDHTHFVCIPHVTADGDMLVLAEGGGAYRPGAYRIAIHPTLHADVPSGTAGQHQVGAAILDEETGFFFTSASIH